MDNQKKGLQSKYDHNADKFHRTSLGIANDLDSLLVTHKGKEFSTFELETLAKVNVISEQSRLSGALQILKKRSAIRRSGKKWQII